MRTDNLRSAICLSHACCPGKTVLLSTIFAVLTLGAAPLTQGADWFTHLGSPTFERIEEINGRIWISVPWSNPGNAITISGLSGTCQITQIQLIPPSGKEKEWLAMVLAAMYAGKTVSVWADCNQAAYRLDASRLVADF